MDEDEAFREWASHHRHDMPDEKLRMLGAVLTGILREGTNLIHEQVLGDDERACLVAATIVFKFERYPGDADPFTGIASIPDIPEIAKSLITRASEALEGVEVDGEE